MTEQAAQRVERVVSSRVIGPDKAKSYTLSEGAPSMRIILVVVGVLVSLAGPVWALQGAGFILGSFMSNDPTWIWIGGTTVLVGLGTLAFGFRSGPATKHT